MHDYYSLREEAVDKDVGVGKVCDKKRVKSMFFEELYERIHHNVQRIISWPV